MDQFSVTGGARVGWVRATWPLAKLTVSSSHLGLAGFMLGSYDFAPNEVVSIERSGSIPLVSAGIRIVHNRSDYPSKMVFWPVGSAENLLARIRLAGFSGTAASSTAARDKGFALRSWFVVSLLVLWNGLFLIDQNRGGEFPGPAVAAATMIVFLLAWGLRRSEWLQGLVLQDGHSINEIKSALVLVQVITGALSAVSLVSLAGHHAA